MKKKKVAIFGGSFNPPHIGHKKVVELVRDNFPCDEIWLMPSGNRRDKEMAVADNHRVEFAKIMADELQKSSKSGNSPLMHVSTIEIDRPIPTATIDTLIDLEKNYPDHEFHFIMSSDLIPDIRKTWEQGEELFNKGKYILLERPGSHKLEHIELPPFSVVIQETQDLPEISSTELRALKSVEELESWTGKAIADYIKTNSLYNFI